MLSSCCGVQRFFVFYQLFDKFDRLSTVVHRFCQENNFPDKFALNSADIKKKLINIKLLNLFIMKSGENITSVLLS